jgi:hypothetical protein
MGMQMKSLNSIFQQLQLSFSLWTDDINQHEVKNIIYLIEQAKLYLNAAEKIPEDNINQFIANLRYDINEFYVHSQAEVKHSLYLGLLNETFWQKMSEITDKSQVEWSELPGDIEHQGIYHSGDFIGFGELECQQCQQSIIYSHASEVLRCFACEGDCFNRIPLKP